MCKSLTRCIGFVCWYKFVSILKHPIPPEKEETKQSCKILEVESN